MRFKYYKKNNFFDKFFYFFLLIIMAIICSLFVLKYISKRFDIILYPMAYEKLRKIVTSLINNSTNDINFDKELFVVDKNNDDEIIMINYNTYEVTKLINMITLNIQNNLEELSIGNNNYYSDYLIDEVPLGVIFNNSLLRNIGPKIKFRTEMMGSIISNIETEVKPYGINNSYIEMRVNLEVKARIHLPFVSEEVTIKNVIPISMGVVQGSVPNGYISTYK